MTVANNNEWSNSQYIFKKALRFWKIIPYAQKTVYLIYFRNSFAKLSISTETKVKKSKKGSLNGKNKCLSIGNLKNIRQSFLNFSFPVWYRITYTIIN